MYRIYTWAIVNSYVKFQEYKSNIFASNHNILKDFLTLLLSDSALRQSTFGLKYTISAPPVPGLKKQYLKSNHGKHFPKKTKPPAEP